jgi:hypothetical protein
MTDAKTYNITFIRGTERMWTGIFVGRPTTEEVAEAIGNTKYLHNDYLNWSLNILRRVGLPRIPDVWKYEVDGVLIGKVRVENSVAYLTDSAAVVAG